MPKLFTKPILSLKDGDTFTIPGEGGSRKIQITPDRLRQWANTFNAMRIAGIQVPAPWSHKDRMGPILMGQANQGGIVEDASRNAGFWKELWYNDNEQTLYGTLEAHGDPKDPNSPAGRVGTAVKETSVYVAPEWEDGRGRKWAEPIMHIGCVVHPIEPNQGNFRPVEQSDMVLCMSFQDKTKPSKSLPPGSDSPGEADEGGSTGSSDGLGVIAPDAADAALEEQPSGILPEGGDLVGVIGLLSEVGIVLPPTTTPDNFLDYLQVALSQYKACQEDEEQDDISIPPEGAQEKQAPFIMSFSNDQLTAIVNAKVVNPTTGKPWSLDELQQAAKVDPPKIDDAVLMSHPTVQRLVSTTDTLANVINEQAKSGYRNRAERLVKLGTIKQDYLDGTLKPLIEGVVMSFENGKPKEGVLDILLKGLEAAAPQNPSNIPGYEAFLAMSHGGMPTGATAMMDLPHANGIDAATLQATQGTGHTPEQIQARIKSWKERGLY